MYRLSLAQIPCWWVSANRLWRAGRGRVYKSSRYDAWREAAGWELVTQRPARVAGPVSITIGIGRPDRRRRDADNFIKALLDLLVAHQVVLTTKWCPSTG